MTSATAYHPSTQQLADQQPTGARYELGKASRWPEIQALNRDVVGNDPNYLTPGLQLVLPDDDTRPVENVTQRPGTGTYRPGTGTYRPGGGALR